MTMNLSPVVLYATVERACRRWRLESVRNRVALEAG